MMVTLCTLCGKSLWNQSWVWWPNCSRSEKQWSPWIWLKFSQHATSVPLIDPWYTRKSFTFLFRKTGVIMLPYLANRFQEVQMKVFKHIKFTEQKDYFLLLNVPCLLCFIILRVQVLLCWYVFVTFIISVKLCTTHCGDSCVPLHPTPLCMYNFWLCF